MADLSDLSEQREGNTKTLSVDKISPGNYWFGTWNNYSDDYLDLFDPKFSKYEMLWIIGEEICPTTGTPHIHIYLECKKKIRPLQVFDFTKSINWQKRGRGSNRQKAVAYVVKDGTNINGNLPYEEPLRLITPGGPGFEWQTAVLNDIKNDNDRIIRWYHEPQGCRGKTAFCKWLCVKKNATICGGKANDIYYVVTKKKESTGCWPTLIVMNIVRSKEQYISYEAIESLKDGLFMSGKYEGAEAVFNSPTVLVFANFEPNYDALSMDRWSVNEI